MSDELKRTLTAKDVAVVTVGTIIGSGIFLTPGNVLAASGGAVGVAIGVWVVGGILTMLGALTYAELGCMRTGAGGLYAYIRDAFGPLAAFAYGWTLFVVLATGSVAALAVATGDNMVALIPGLSPSGKKVVALVMIAVLAAVNVIGTKRSTAVLGLATILKVSALLFLIVALPLAGTGWSTVTAAWPESWSGPIFLGGLAALISTLWAYEGWQYATFVGGEVKNPQRDFPLGLMVGTLLCITIYVLANVGYVAGLGPERLASSTTVASDAVGAAFGPATAKLIAAAVLVSIVSGAHGIMLTSSRVFHAMARDRVFFQALGAVHPRFGTPANSIVAIAAWSAVLALSGQFTVLLTYVVFVGWVFYGLGGLCVIAFRRRDPTAARPFKVPLYPITPILFVASAAVIVINTVIQDPLKGVIGLGGAALGVPIFFLWRRGAEARG
ncbi:MAG: amino acid permease [Gemmatimonadetes bacterium]|nr:amino acid permease [Gemmatimonadota bacterium]